MEDEYVVEEYSDEDYNSSSSEDEFQDFIKRECGILEVEDDFEAEVDKVMTAHMQKLESSEAGNSPCNEASSSADAEALNCKAKQEEINDDLLYDPNMDDEDEKWIQDKRRSYIFPSDVKNNKQIKPLPNSDAVLNCPACLSLLCLDCQRHEVYKNQYRAMFVSNCSVVHAETLKYPVKKKKTKKLIAEQRDENYNPVRCSVCNTEVAVYDTEEIYHFFNVLVFVFSVMRGPFLEDFHQCVTYAFYTARWQERLYTSISLVLMFLIPLVVLVATYVATFATIASQDKTFLEHGVSSVIVSARHQFLHRAKMKSLMITVVIVLAFLVCWTPYYVTMIVFVFLEPDEQLGQDLQAAIFFFGSSTALLNPLIYGAFHLRRPGKPRRTASAPSGSGSSLVPTVRGSRATDRNRADTLEMRRANGGHGPCVLQQYPCQRGAWPDPTTGDPQQVCQ